MFKFDFSSRAMPWVVLFLVLVFLLAGLQIWNAYKIRSIVEGAQATASAAASKDALETEDARQGVIAKQIDNESKGALSVGLTSGLSAALAALTAVVGAVLALSGYIDAREKERQDRLGTALNDAITRLVASDGRSRVVGAAGLLPFFAADRADFHHQALAALIAAARFPDSEAAPRQGIRLAVERAVATVAPAILAEVSWQGVRLADVNLARARLAGIDLRDAELENADFSGADLSGADLTAARLQGARFDGAVLRDARLAYADLAGAAMPGTVLEGAALTGVKVLNLDLDRADFRGIGIGWRDLPWDATRNWRQAKFDAPVRAELDRAYGAAVPKLKVMMLVWEIPPMVAGGTWTACYHLVRNLVRRGAEVEIVVPWRRDTLKLDPPPFGIDVPIVTLEIDVPSDAVSRGAQSPYGTWAPGPYLGVYTGPYWSGYAYGAGMLSGSTLFRLITAFARRLGRHAADHPADIIHAHDWVTFEAARTAAERIGVPWVAHFHSIEADRQPDGADPLTERIERSAVDTASRIVAVSEATARAIRQAYDPAGRRMVDVVPNGMSEGAAPLAEMGRFETHRVLFLGRQSRQKGVDRFCAVAKRLREAQFNADFVAYGEGPEQELLRRNGIWPRGALEWEKRGTAFTGASVLLVPSRAEPFGMVVLEAMQHRVPVIYPAQSGAAEVLDAGVKLDADDIQAMADAVMHLLGDRGAWEEAIDAGAREIEAYRRRAFEDRLLAVWTQALAEARRQPTV